MDRDSFENFAIPEDDHTRSIVHIDIDCFYAQVEMMKYPELRNVPLGIQQKNIVVTSNYEARKFGIKKCMLVKEALALCPTLKLVKGEDLHDYKVASSSIFIALQSYKCPVEKLGMDEIFIDVTRLVTEYLEKNDSEIGFSGHEYKEANEFSCSCGCYKRLRCASLIASEMRHKIFSELGLTTSAGIAHNKLLAKLICNTYKPNDQTTIYPIHAMDFISTLESVLSITGIGCKTAETIQNYGIKSVKDLQEADIEMLSKYLSWDMAVRLKQLSEGIDKSIVKQSAARPNTIGLEDSSKVVSLQSEVEEKFNSLLDRLAALVVEDGRIPITLRVTLRKKDGRRLSSHRESRQTPVPPSTFTINEGSVSLTDKGHDKLMAVIMRLFHKLVDLKKPFHLTLLGLAFIKFRERMSGRSSIVNYFMNDISVQSVMSLQNDSDVQSVCSMDLSASSPTGSTTTDFSDCEFEPSPKKVKRVNWMAKKRCFSKGAVASPSKLNVSELRLNSKELEKVSELRLSSKDREASSSNGHLASPLDCPNQVQFSVSSQKSVNWKNSTNHLPNVKQSVSKPNTILRYFIPNK